MKYLALVTVILLAACKTSPEIVKSKTPEIFDVVCYSGVEYLVYAEHSGGHQGFGFMAPHMKPDGSVHTCESEAGE